MSRFVEGQDRQQVTLLPECLDDFIAEDNPVRVVDAFVAELDLGELGFDGVRPADTGRPSYHPAVLLKIYIYGYLNRVQSSRRLEHECQRNVELMWLTGRLAPDFKTIADFRHDNGAGDTQRLPSLRGAVPGAQALLAGRCRGRQQQVQGGQQS
jgi:transposase